MSLHCPKLNSSIYKSSFVKRGLKFAANNGTLFAAGTSLVLATTVRPLAILATPKTDKENKKLACAKSVASTMTGYLLMLAATRPVSKAIRKIDYEPEKYLSKFALKSYKKGVESLSKSDKYKFATQLFKLGVGLVFAMPKSLLVCALTPIVLAKIFKNHESSGMDTPFKGKEPNFTSNNDRLSKLFGKILNTYTVRNFSQKYKDSNFAMHMMAITDSLATLSFVKATKKSKKIIDERKKPLIWNSLISTGLSIAGGYIVDKALNKPTEKFIKKFRQLNSSDPKLEKYIEGIKIAKPVLILGSIYYLFIPFISTFLADRTGKSSCKN